MTDSFGFNGEEKYANRIEPIKEDLASSVNDPEVMMLIIKLEMLKQFGQCIKFMNAKTILIL